jgi:hypothetical protein
VPHHFFSWSGLSEGATVGTEAAPARAALVGDSAGVGGATLGAPGSRGWRCVKMASSRCCRPTGLVNTSVAPQRTNCCKSVPREFPVTPMMGAV